jgi:hypothetical protein
MPSFDSYGCKTGAHKEYKLSWQEIILLIPLGVIGIVLGQFVKREKYTRVQGPLVKHHYIIYYLLLISSNDMEKLIKNPK